MEKHWRVGDCHSRLSEYVASISVAQYRHRMEKTHGCIGEFRKHPLNLHNKHPMKFIQKTCLGRGILRPKFTCRKPKNWRIVASPANHNVFSRGSLNFWNNARGYPAAQFVNAPPIKWVARPVVDVCFSTGSGISFPNIDRSTSIASEIIFSWGCLCALIASLSVKIATSTWESDWALKESQFRQMV